MTHKLSVPTLAMGIDLESMVRQALRHLIGKLCFKRGSLMFLSYRRLPRRRRPRPRTSRKFPKIDILGKSWSLDVLVPVPDLILDVLGCPHPGPRPGRTRSSRKYQLLSKY